MACCPFHDDKNPSMKVDQRFHCFGCGADGDVIDFTAKLFDLSPKEAAEKLAQDFGLIYDSQALPRRRYVRQKTEAQKFREDRHRCYRVLSDYYLSLIHIFVPTAAASCTSSDTRRTSASRTVISCLLYTSRCV